MTRPLRLPLPYNDQLHARYASPTGDDSNDGLDWRYPCKTIYACIDSLNTAGSPNGTIYYMNGTYTGNVMGGGIWLTENASPAPGFKRCQGAYSFQGVGGIQAQFMAPSAVFNMGVPGSAGDAARAALPARRQTAIWMYDMAAGGNSFRDMQCPYTNAPVRIGINGDPLVDPDTFTEASRGTAQNCPNVFFDNVWVPCNQGANCGPGIDIGYTFFFHFNRVKSTGNASASQFADERYAFRVRGKEDPITHITDGGSSDVRFKDCVGHAGGVRYYAGGTTWQFEVHDLIVESYDGETMPPVVWASNLSTFGSAIVEFARKADEVTHDPTIPNVQFDGVHRPEQISVASSWNVRGQHSIRTLDVNDDDSRTVNLAREGDVGFGFTKWWGDNNVSRNQSSLVTQSAKSLYPIRSAGVPVPIASQFNGGGITVTTGLADRYGGTTAFQISGASGDPAANYQSIGGNYDGRTMAVGDMLAVGMWVRAPSGFNQFSVSFDIRDLFTAKTPPTLTGLPGMGLIASNSVSDGEYQWFSMGLTVTATPFPSAVYDIFTLVHMPAGHPVVISHPVILYFNNGSITPNTFAEMVQQMPGFIDTAPINSVTTQLGQKLIAQGGIGVGNYAAATTPGSVVKKIQVFDEFGNSLGYVPVYSSIT